MFAVPGIILATATPDQLLPHTGAFLAEALYLGTPVVATRVGGIPEIVVEGETGYLVDLDAAFGRMGLQLIHWRADVGRATTTPVPASR